MNRPVSGVVGAQRILERVVDASAPQEYTHPRMEQRVRVHVRKILACGWGSVNTIIRNHKIVSVSSTENETEEDGIREA